MPGGGGAVKVLGSLLLLLSGLLWGAAKSRELWRRERLLREWQRLLQNLQTSVRCWARPLGELVEKEDSPFCRAAVERPCFSQDPRAALAQAGEELLTRTSDRALYQGFVAGLGVSDVQGQLQHMGLYAGLVEQALGEAREERGKLGRLYVCLGLFGGLTVCLLLL